MTLEELMVEMIADREALKSGQLTVDEAKVRLGQTRGILDNHRTQLVRAHMQASGALRVALPKPSLVA